MRDADLPPPEVPVLRWHYGDWESGRQEERRALANSSSFCQAKAESNAKRCKSTTVLLQKKRWGKRLCTPPSFPIQRQSTRRPVHPSELSGWQFLSPARLLLKQINLPIRHSQPKNQTLWQFSSNTYRWACSSQLSNSSVWKLLTHQTQNFSTEQEWGRSIALPEKTNHSTSIPSSQKASLRGCGFVIFFPLRALHHRKHFRKRLHPFCQRLPTLLEWPLVNH